VVREELERLSKLQELDMKIDKARNMKTALPRTLAGLEADVSGFRSKIAALEAELSTLERQKRSAEMDNTMDQDRIKNIDERLGAIANNKEFHAVAKEADKARKNITDRTTQIIQLGQQADVKKVEIEKIQGQINELEGQLNSKRAEVEKEIGAFELEASSIEGDRVALTEGISNTVMSRYNRIRTRFSQAVVQVVDGHCQACNVALPPQMYIRVQKGHELITCPSCQRLLYFKNGLSS